MVELPFVGQSYKMDALDVSAQRCVNMYPEVYTDSGAKTQMSLRSTHGLLAFGTVGGTNQIRGLYVASSGTLFSVTGKKVESIDTAGTNTDLFDLSTGDTPGASTIVRFADTAASANRTAVDAGEASMLIADGTTDAFTYNLDTEIATQITDAQYPGGSFCGVLDGYFLVNKPNTFFIYYSSLEDPTVWSDTQRFAKESTSENVNGFIVSDGKIWVFGTRGYEIFYNTGNTSGTLFLRIEGSQNEIGLHAPDSLAQDETNVFWLGANDQGYGRIYMSEGFEARPISTVPIEREIHTYTTTSDAEGFTFQQDGHSFYQLTFPSENKTWVYDKTTGLWHEKLYRNPTTSVDERHRARVQVFFNGKNYFGDWQNNQLYEVSQTTYTDDGDTIIRKRVSPTHWNALERIKFKSFELDIESGQGLATGQGSDPLLKLRWSNDGGHTWGNRHNMSVGKIGEYDTRVKLNRLGQSRKRVWEVTYSEPTAFTILNAHVEVG